MRVLGLLLATVLIASPVMAGILTTPTKTASEIGKEDALFIAKRTNNAVSRYAKKHEELFNRFWARGCVNAQLIADVIGDESGKMFVNSALTTAHLQSIGAEVDSLVPPCTVVDANDGESIDLDTTTVTITGTFTGY